jgi:hypothetical protein
MHKDARGGGWTTFLVCLAMSLAGFAVVVGLVRRDTACRQAAARERADQDMAELVASARRDLTQGHFDTAFAQLHRAIGVDDATELDAAEDLLRQARHAKAAAVERSVEAALADKAPAHAADLLRRYLANPDVLRADEFAAWLRDIEAATSTTHASAVLHNASDKDLARLAAGEPWTGPGAVSRASVRVVQADTLRRHLPEEQARRARDRADREAARVARERAAAEKERQARRAREARFRRTPLFRELQDFVSLTRAACANRSDGEDADAEWLASLLRGFDVNDPAARDRALGEIERRRQVASAEEREPPAIVTLLQDIARQRARLKERLRVFYQEFDATDWPWLDRLIDRELDQLSAAVQGTGETSPPEQGASAP